MSQNREKDEKLELKVPSETPPISFSCPDKCKKYPSPTSSTRPEICRVDPVSLTPAQPRSKREAQDLEKTIETTCLKEREEKTVEVGVTVVKKAINRCSGCGKRVGLTGFRCRCGDLFCGEHRYSDRHDCGFDYKSAGREAIARENPVVRASKILKV